MTKFGDAFKRGQNAADRATRANKEVDEVIQAVAAEVFAATEETIAIKIEKHPFASLVEPIAFLKGISARRDEFKFVGARNVEAMDRSPVELATWTRSEAGYPCTLSYGETEVHAHDRVSLESAFAELLASPHAGTRLQELLNRERPPLTTGHDDL